MDDDTEMFRFQQASGGCHANRRLTRPASVPDTNNCLCLFVSHSVGENSLSCGLGSLDSRHDVPVVDHFAFCLHCTLTLYVIRRDSFVTLTRFVN